MEGAAAQLDKGKGQAGQTAYPRKGLHPQSRGLGLFSLEGVTTFEQPAYVEALGAGVFPSRGDVLIRALLTGNGGDFVLGV